MRTCHLDVSKWNTITSFEAARNAGFTSVIVRATVGAGYVDERFHEYARAVLAAGLTLGAYCVLSPIYSAQSHYDNFLKAVTGYPVKIVALDVELDGGVTMTKRTDTYNALIWMLYQRFRAEALILTYSRYEWWKRMIGTTKKVGEWWGARYPNESNIPKCRDLVWNPGLVPAPWTYTELWQYTSHYRNDPICKSNLDANVSETMTLVPEPKPEPPSGPRLVAVKSTMALLGRDFTDNEVHIPIDDNVVLVFKL